MKKSEEHRVKVFKIMINKGTGKKPIPYKWKGECSCGWGCISWEWVRHHDEGCGGAFVMAREHIGDDSLCHCQEKEEKSSSFW